MAYNTKLILDYINGDELDGYDVDELENDPEFMIQAIMASGDKKLYNLCSSKVKSDLKFVSMLILRFKTDVDFIDSVADEFLKLVHDDYERTNVIVQMCNALENAHHEEQYAKYRILFMAKFMTEMLGNVAYREVHPEDREFGLGFSIFYDQYNGDEEVIKYYARQSIDYLLDEEVNLKDVLHSMYDSPSEITKGGTVTFMVDFLRRYDEDLSDYAAVHPDVLKTFQERLKKVMTGWDNYTNREEEYNYEMMFTRVHDYYQSVEMQTTISEEAYIYYVGRELGISSKIAFYQGMSREEYEQFFDDEDHEFIQSELSSLQSRIVYNNIKRIMLETIFDQKEERKTGGQIIELDFTKLGR